ncbi:hypothetical protein [Streptomyces sp. SID13588]|uniref:hypothetical protein n=1 Tax=Streptomyces sp. SID13588 TaxID=2706051 RepID=UPI0013C9AF20|nr:hypothetical protein [Streptomyces sp. SID13588]NEA73793.1 hypothetical protein [Streptomyces sp. SID13588]
MSPDSETQVVLVEFHGIEPRNSLTVLAKRLPQQRVHVWDVLTEDVLSADSLSTFAAGLIASNPIDAAPLAIVGSCFGAQLVTACAAQWQSRATGPVLAVTIDPVVISEEVLQSQARSLATRVGADLSSSGVTTEDWLDHVLARLRLGAVRQAVADGDDPTDAQDVADLLVRHYRLWLRYLWLCRYDRSSAHVSAVLSEAAQADGAPVDEVLRLGSFVDTSDVLTSDELVGWVLRAPTTREGAA